jgi:hypothetical protein
MACVNVMHQLRQPFVEQIHEPCSFRSPYSTKGTVPKGVRHCQGLLDATSCWLADFNRGGVNEDMS